VEEGSYGRRRWLDWAVFHVEPQFATHWTRYQRALKQRNALLRQGGTGLDVWDLELQTHGQPLTVAREGAMAGLAPFWDRLVLDLVGKPVEISFLRGWSREHDFAEALQLARPRDEQRGATGVGPHRADVSMRVDGKPARDVLSRGQQKLAAAALILAQLQYLKAVADLRPILLLDDPAAELDDQRLAQFIAAVSGLETQLIVTSLRSDFRVFGTPERVFHVEQGRVQEL
jgi:DNA replication and repair protein RecF